MAVPFAPWGQEIVSVTFAGNDCGTLAPTMQKTTGFFEALAG